jgi:glycosyltransferase involved in cell wall biosynthesis
MANILHIAAHLGDGAGKAISGLAIADRANDHTVFLLDAPRKLNHVENCRANGVRVIINGDIGTVIGEADVVIINWWGHPLTDEFIANFPQKESRVALWMHKNGFHDPPLPDEYLKIADTVMVTSPYSLESEWFKEAVLVYGFGDFNPQDLPCKADYSAVSDRFAIGYVGSPTYKKLPDDFLDYCWAVKDAIPDVRFVLVGETDSVIQRDIAQSGLADCFDIRGWVTDVGELLLSFDVFGYLLKPDTFATTENAILEAMAAGLPVVTSQQPLGKYFVEHEKTGYLVSLPREYADVMLRLYSDTRLRERIGKAGRARCAEKYSVERNIAAFDEIITKVMQKDKSTPRTTKQESYLQ